MSVRDLPVTASRLRIVARRLELDEPAYDRARELAGLTVERQELPERIDRFLLGAGVALVVAGIAAFFAWNWADLHKFAKFALIQMGIVATVAAAWWRGLDTGPGRAALLAAGSLVGVALAVYGQTYQTGADPYGLFVAWAVLILGWAVIGRQAGLWMLMLVLSNLGVIFYWTQVLHPQAFGLEGLGPLFALTGLFTDARLADLTFAINAAALLLWETIARRGVAWVRGRTFPRVVSLLALAPVVFSALILIVGAAFESPTWNVLALLLFLGFASTSSFYFRFRVHDLFILTICLVGGIMMSTAFVAQLFGGGFEIAFVLAALVVGQTAAAAVWLRRVSQQWEGTP